jgi:hypothetical protein
MIMGEHVVTSLGILNHFVLRCLVTMAELPYWPGSRKSTRSSHRRARAEGIRLRRAAQLSD